MDLASIVSTLDFSKVPLVQPPSGAQSNFTTQQTIAPTARAIIYSTWSLMVLFLLLRAYSRARVTCSLGADDFLCIIAALCVTAESGVILSFIGQLGHHGWDVSVIEYFAFGKLQLAVLSLYLLTAIFLKSALLVFDIRIFQPKRGARIVLWTSIAVILIFNLTVLIVCDTFCGQLNFTPPDDSTLISLIQQSNNTQMDSNTTALVYNAIGLWVEAKTHADRCGDVQKIIAVTHGVFNFIADFYILFVTIGLTLSLHLPLKRKAAVCAIFLLGLLACACSIISTYYRIVLFHSDDVTWVSSLSITIGIAEHNIGIICSSMPSMPVLYKSCINSSLWSQFSSFSTLRRHRNTSNVKGPRSLSSHPKAQQRSYIDIPRRAITGLTSLILRNNRTQAPQQTEMSEYIEIQSIHDEYHAYIKGKTDSSQPTPQVGKRNCSIT